jgi:dTDP-glucose 4,6-dehydratase/UDP-glucuronate decarboxylase
LARARNARGFLFFSSGEIYGDVPAAEQPIQETYAGANSPIGPRACYTESKRMGETLTITFHREFGVPANIVRPFQVYGPGLRLDDGRVIPDFLKSRLLGEPIHLLSDGSAVRTFCYAADGVAGFWAALLADEFGLAINIGDDREPVSILELAELVADLEAPSLDVTREELELPDHLRGNPSRACPDVGEARKVLGYETRTSLSEGLLRTLRWFRDQDDA